MEAACPSVSLLWGQLRGATLWILASQVWNGMQPRSHRPWPLALHSLSLPCLLPLLPSCLDLNRACASSLLLWLYSCSSFRCKLKPYLFKEAFLSPYRLGKTPCICSSFNHQHPPQWPDFSVRFWGQRETVFYSPLYPTSPTYPPNTYPLGA